MVVGLICRWWGLARLIAGVAVLALATPAVCQAAGVGIDISRPRIGVPAFIEAGGVFNVDVTVSAPLASGTWRVKLINDLREWSDCVVDSVDQSRGVQSNSAACWRLRVRAPRDIPPELFGVAVSHQRGGTAISIHAVQVVQSFESSFYILHWGDPQIVQQGAVSRNGQAGRFGTAQGIKWAAPAFNLINPRFIMETGDEVENGEADTDAKYAWYLEAVNTFSFPLLITRGNNDRGDIGKWMQSIGQPTYSLTMGSFYVGMNDASPTGELARKWFESDYSASFRNRDIAYRLLGQHFTGDDRTPFAFSPPRDKPPDLMLVGHNHTWATLQKTPYFILSSGPASSYGKAALFEFNRTAKGWECPSVATHGSGNVVQPYGDNGEPTVSCTFATPNDGTTEENTARVKNSLGLGFPDGRLRFLLRRVDGGHKVEGGVKLAEYGYGRSNTAVLVRVNIPRKDVAVVTLSRAR